MSEHNILGAILAGGQSKRMGKDKLFLELNNKKLIEHTIDKVKKYLKKIIIITNQDNEFFFKNNLTTVKDFSQQAKGCFDKSANSFDKEWREFDKIMTKNNISRKECLLLPINTMLDALSKKSL